MVQFDLKKALAIIVIAIFVFEIISFGLSGNQGVGNNLNPGTNVPSIKSGNANIQVLIQDYDPYLLLAQKEVTAEVIQKLREDNRVESVRLLQGSYIVTLVKRDDLTALFSELRMQGLVPQAIALIQFPQLIELNQSNGDTSEMYSDGITIKQTLDYIIPIGESVNASIQATQTNGKLSSLMSFAFDKEEIGFQANGTISEFNSIRSKYMIPWEMRNDFDSTSLKQALGINVSYSKKNYVLPEFNLSAEQMVLAENLDYITQVNADKLMVSTNFTDKLTIENALGVSLSFPESELVLEGEGELGSGLMPEKTYLYDVVLNDTDDYNYGLGPVEAAFGTAKNNGEQVTLEITAEAIGSTITKVLNAEEKP